MAPVMGRVRLETHEPTMKSALYSISVHSTTSKADSAEKASLWPIYTWKSSLLELTWSKASRRCSTTSISLGWFSLYSPVNPYQVIFLSWKYSNFKLKRAIEESIPEQTDSTSPTKPFFFLWNALSIIIKEKHKHQKKQT